MPFKNLGNRHFDNAEKDTIRTAVQNLETALADKLAQLTPAERQQYGSVNEQNKLIINKVKQYRDNDPNKSSPDVDWAEFESDFASRSFLEGIIHQLESLLTGCKNAKILHDFDNYKAAMSDYEYTKYKVSTGSAGYETKMNELKQFFSGGGAKNTTTTPNPSDTE